MYIIGCKTLDDLNNFSNSEVASASLAARRGATKIAIIDDEEIAGLKNLKSYGYNIVVFNDIDRATDIEEYDIILCDVMGVGLNFSSESQGAELIREIKNNFPSKYVLAYTGNLKTNVQAILAEKCFR